MPPQTSNTTKERELFLHLGPDPIADRESAIDACMIDAAADRKWFRQHPEKRERHRPASPRERKANGLPMGSTVVVMLLEHGAQARVFYGPNEHAVPNPVINRKK